ncbi:MFS transporter [Endozoicomonadaceae bacterium StTr2]
MSGNIDRQILSRQQLTALISGNTIEYYDYVVYGLLTPVLSTLFFPAEDRFTSLLQTFIAFATTMLARPVGSVVIGFIGDLTDRKNALLLSSLITGLGTFCIGLLPDTSHATLLLILFRMMQGFGMSSEFCSVLVVTGEMAPPKRRGLLTSLAHSSGMLGTLLASAIVTLVFLLPEEDLYSWGWRVPFWLGGLICLTSWIIRKNLPEQKQTGNTRQLGKKLVHNWIALGRLLFVVAGNTTLYHLLFVFFSTYLIEVFRISTNTAMLVNSINLIGLVFFCALGGWLSDQLGRKQVYIGSVFVQAIIVAPTFWMMSQGNGWYCLIGQAILALLTGIIMGSSSALYTELLPAGIRITGTTLPYNLAILVFGGTSPLIALKLTEWTGLSWSPGLYLSGLCLVIICCLIGYKQPDKIAV